MKYIYFFLLLTVFTDCKGQSNNNAAQKEEKQGYRFQMVSIPTMLTTPDDRAAYLVEHYWDNFNFEDTLFLSHKETVEQSFVDYIDIFPYTTQAVVSKSINNMMKKSDGEEKILTYFADLYEKYLYDPNSPMRNDEYYIPVLESLLKSSTLKSKIRQELLLEMACKNRIGNTANNFTYTLADGQNGTLHNIRADYSLIFFYNPDCKNCKEVAEDLKKCEVITSMQAKGQIKILAIYTDADLEAWKRYLSQMPKEWIVAYDAKQTIEMESLYDLKAIPTLYLLDKYKKVLLKDVAFEQLDGYLTGL